MKGVLQAVLRAEQRDAGDRGRHRQARDEEAHREIFRIAQARPGRSAGEGRDAADHRGAPPGRQDRVELPRVYMAWHSPAFFKRGDADAESPRHPRDGALEPAVQEARLRKADRPERLRVSVFADARVACSASTRPRGPGRRCRSSRRPSTRSSSSSGGRPAGGEVDGFATSSRRGTQRAAAARRVRRRGRSAEPLQPLRRHTRLSRAGHHAAPHA